MLRIGLAAVHSLLADCDDVRPAGSAVICWLAVCGVSTCGFSERYSIDAVEVAVDADTLQLLATLHRQIADVLGSAVSRAQPPRFAGTSASPQAQLPARPSDFDRARARRVLDQVESPTDTINDPEWVDQKESPLGRHKHLSLVRSGKLPGLLCRHRL